MSAIKINTDVHYVVAGIRDTLLRLGKNPELDIAGFGQVLAEKERQEGKRFSSSDHVRGLVLALLSARVPWERIARNLSQLGDVFFDWDFEKIQKANPHLLVQKVKELKCGNQVIFSQMSSLSPNLHIFEVISNHYGSLDAFVASSSPLVIAGKLSDSGSEYKLKQVGFAVACEYLRNVGIGYVKPDTHIVRITGPERLNMCPNARGEKQVAEELSNMALSGGMSATYLDNMLWVFAAKDYGEVCSAHPRCGICALRSRCNYSGPTAD